MKKYTVRYLCYILFLLCTIVPAQILAKGKPVSPEYATFIDTLTKAINKSDVDFMTAHFDLTEYMTGILRSVAPKKDMHRIDDMVDSLFLSMDKNPLLKARFAQMGKGLLEDLIGEDMEVSVVGSQEVDDDKVEVFYNLDNNSEYLYYYKITLEKQRGKIVITDVYLYLTGSSTAERLALVLEGISSAVPTDKENSKAKKEEMLTTFLQSDSYKLLQLYSFMKTGNELLVKENIKKLPKKLHHHSVVNSIKILTAMRSDTAYFYEVGQEFHKKYGPRSAYSSFLHQYYLAKKEYRNAHKALEHILKEVPDTLEIAMEQADVYQKQKKYKKAWKIIRHYLEREDAKTTPYYQLFSLLIETKRYADLVTVLDIFYLKYDLSFTRKTLEKYELYTNFLASNEFKEWEKTIK